MSKISIIVPVYNSEKYLRRCIESILSQTFRNFEIFLLMTAAMTAAAVYVTITAETLIIFTQYIRKIRELQRQETPE